MMNPITHLLAPDASRPGPVPAGKCVDFEMAGSAVAAALATQGLVGWSSSASVPHSQCAVVNVEQEDTPVGMVPSHV